MGSAVLKAVSTIVLFVGLQSRNTVSAFGILALDHFYTIEIYLLYGAIGYPIVMSSLIPLK